MDAASEMQAKIDASMSGHWLYDPPINGKTPLNGSGLPSKSLIMGDISKKLILGFTLEAVGMEGPEIPVEVPEKVEPPKEAVEANIKGKQARTRTIKR